MDKDINLKDNFSNDEENITLNQVFSIFLRRSKLFVFVTLLFFSGAIVYAINERATNPIYRGNFAIMTSDPINSGSVGGEGDTVGVEALAKNKSNIDIGTL